MMTLGDIVSQQAVEKRGFEGHDFKRSFRMTVYGALIGGPVIGTWFGFINRVITIKNKWAGKSLLISHTMYLQKAHSFQLISIATIVRVGIDQAFFSPAILAIFMGGISVLEGRNLAEIKEKFHKSYFNGLMNSYCYWPFVNMFTFAFIPVHYRPIVNSGFGIAWNTYLSHLNQKSLQSLHALTALPPTLNHPTTQSPTTSPTLSSSST